MKKICVSVLCFLMVLALVGCGGNDASSAGSNEPSDETSREDNNAEPSLDLTGSWIQAEKNPDYGGKGNCHKNDSRFNYRLHPQHGASSRHNPNSD